MSKDADYPLKHSRCHTVDSRAARDLKLRHSPQSFLPLSGSQNESADFSPHGCVFSSVAGSFLTTNIKHVTFDIGDLYLTMSTILVVGAVYLKLLHLVPLIEIIC